MVQTYQLQVGLAIVRTGIERAARILSGLFFAAVAACAGILGRMYRNQKSIL